KLKPEEIVGIQILIQPVRPEWRDEFKPVVEELKAKASLKPEAMAGEALAALGKAMRTPGETEVLRAVERNLSHPAFKTLIRFIYLSPKSMFYDSFARRGLVGSFNQYAAYDMNHFVQNYSMSTRVRLWHWPHFFPRRREQVRKSRLLLYYCKREIPTKPFMGKLISSYFMNWNFASKMYIMTTESLATLFHPPTFVVLTAPHVKRVESRKYAPPAGLPIYGEDRDVDKLK
ncbi:MAG: hypothetical protein HY978_02895, partial [Candidatus Liptonbacteria bacterium]|nr:hypothetical protein [Candidatus Liptonbacteria bacterium]